MKGPRNPRRTPDQPGSGSLLWGAGAALPAVLCCAGPALLAAGAASGVLGAIGAWLASPLGDWPRRGDRRHGR